MDFISIRIISADVARLVAFYERTTGTAAAWATDDFAQLHTPTGTIAIGSPRTVAMLPPGTLRPAANASVIVEFRTTDVDAVHSTVDGDAVVLPPTVMPWGNRSLLVRDPDGNLVNFFTPAPA